MARIQLLILAAGILLIPTGCAIFGGESGIDRAGGYTVQAPAGWKSTDRAESDRAYRLPSGNVVTLTSSCHKNADAPLEVLSRHLLIGARNVEVVERRRIPVDGVEGLFSRVRATFDKARGYLVLFVVAKQDCVFDFSLVSNKIVPDKDIDDFLDFVRTFKYGKS